MNANRGGSIEAAERAKILVLVPPSLRVTRSFGAVSVTLCALCLASGAQAGIRTSASYSIVGEAIDGGGGPADSVHYSNQGSVGAITGGGQSSDFEVVSGSLPTTSNSLAIAPKIAVPPTAPSVIVGDAATFTVSVTADPGPSYQWQRRTAGSSEWIDLANDSIYTGARTSTLRVSSSGTMNGDEFRVVIINGIGAGVVSQPVALTVTFPPRLLNLSTRALCLTGSDVVIPGFVIDGLTNKRLLIRAVGPTLGTLFGVTGALEDPRITLKQQISGTFVDRATNDDWSTNTNGAEIVSRSAAVGAFPLPDGSSDAALLVDLPPGVYTVVADGANNTTGVSLVELYDADTIPSTTKLTNISNRGFVGAGADIMIPGYVVSSEGPRTLLVRAVGPALGTLFGLTGVLADPQLVIHRHENGGSVPVAQNDDWSSDSGAVAERVGAFALPNQSKDAALVVTLPPGVYTVHASGVGATTGIALVEIYEVP